MRRLPSQEDRRATYRAHRVVVPLACLALLTALGCSSGEQPPGPSSEAATTTTAESTTTTTAIDPESVRLEDVQATVDALDDSSGAMIRRVREDGALTPETEQWLSQLFVEPELAAATSDIKTHVEHDFATVRDEPEGPETSVDRLVTVTPYCIYAEVTRSYEPVLRRVVDASMTDGYLALAWDDQDRVDPTGAILPPWRIGFEGQLESGDVPSDPCVG